MLKEVNQPTLVLSSTSVSATTTVTGSISNVLYRDTVSYQANFSGVPVGYFQANVSLDYNPGSPQSAGTLNPGHWASIGSVSIDATSTSPVVMRFRQVGEPYIQFQFVSSTSSGVIDMRVCGKSLG